MNFGLASNFETDPNEFIQLIERSDVALYNRLGGSRGIADKLKVDLQQGLIANQDQTTRKAKYGENQLPEPPQKSFFKLLLESLKDLTIIILLVCATISLFFGIFFPEKGEEKTSWIEGAAILGAVVIVTFVTSINEYTQELQFRKLNRRKEDRTVTVIRSGGETQVNVKDLLVGDICVVRSGDKLAADGVLIDSDALQVDESIMTGEAESVKKSLEGDWRMLGGCQVDGGHGKFLIVAVGKNSQWGKTLLQLRTPAEHTPLQDSLEALAKRIGTGGLVVAALVFVILAIYWIIDISQEPWAISHLQKLLESFIIAVTILVVAVPEGLPLAVTISLAYSMRHMIADNNLVRKLAACETMGGVTDICSDKTGTLTLNQMTIVKGWVAQQNLSDIAQLKDQVSPEIVQMLVDSCAINSTAHIDDQQSKANKESNALDNRLHFIGSKTEGALLGFVYNLGANYRQIRADHPVLKCYDFSSDRKRMSSVCKNQRGYRLHCKGAPEMVIELCGSQLSPHGEIVPLLPEHKEQLKALIKSYAEEGYRTLCLAYRDLDHFPHHLDPNQDQDQQQQQQQPQQKQQQQQQLFALENPGGLEEEEVGIEPPAPEVEKEMVWMGVFAIEDPLRPEVPGAVADCQRAGVIVRMVTGDNPDTALTIARRAGIVSPSDLAKASDACHVTMTGGEFAKLSDAELDAILPHLRVLARSTPSDKLRLVQRLKANNRVVSVTGDGTNDAPALKEAHVGLAMGISGTEVAKEAADIIILDDNFLSIVKAMKWGRCIFDNIRKFLQFQLTVNVGALMVAFVGALTRMGTPLAAVQLLWVNLLMDTLAALSLGTEKPHDRLLDRPPVNLKEAWLLKNSILKNVMVQALYQTSVLLGMLYLTPLFFSAANPLDHTVHYTLIFNTFVFCQLFNELNCRKIEDKEWNIFEGILNNWYFLGIMAFTVISQCLIVEFGGAVFVTAPLPWYFWLISIGFGFLSIPLGQILRCIPVPARDGCGFAHSFQFTLPGDIGPSVSAAASQPAVKKSSKKYKKKEQATLSLLGGDDEELDDYGEGSSIV